MYIYIYIGIVEPDWKLTAKSSGVNVFWALGFMNKPLMVGKRREFSLEHGVLFLQW